MTPRACRTLGSRTRAGSSRLVSSRHIHVTTGRSSVAVASRRIRSNVNGMVAGSSNAHDSDLPEPMSKYGTERIELGKTLALVMDAMPCRPRYFLDNGTLLGVWRDGQLIEKDDDFDFGLLVDKAVFQSPASSRSSNLDSRLTFETQARRNNISLASSTATRTRSKSTTLPWVPTHCKGPSTREHGITTYRPTCRCM